MRPGPFCQNRQGLGVLVQGGGTGLLFRLDGGGTGLLFRLDGGGAGLLFGLNGGGAKRTPWIFLRIWQGVTPDML